MNEPLAHVTTRIRQDIDHDPGRRGISYDPEYTADAIDGYRRTPADDRIRSLFWLVVMPACYAGLGILVWAIWTVIR